MPKLHDQAHVIKVTSVLGQKIIFRVVKTAKWVVKLSEWIHMGCFSYKSTATMPGHLFRKFFVNI